MARCLSVMHGCCEGFPLMHLAALACWSRLVWLGLVCWRACGVCLAAWPCCLAFPLAGSGRLFWSCCSPFDAAAENDGPHGGWLFKLPGEILGVFLEVGAWLPGFRCGRPVCNSSCLSSPGRASPHSWFWCARPACPCWVLSALASWLWWLVAVLALAVHACLCFHVFAHLRAYL